MDKDILIKVGIKTKGIPILKKENGLVTVENMLIGDNFHWEKSLSVNLPGEVIPLPSIDPSQKISLINILPLETYLECVVGSEMNPSAPPEFLKAHAVISRSWAVGKILGLHPVDKTGEIRLDDILVGWEDSACHEGYDVCSDDHCQRYQGVQPISEEGLKAIRETAHEVLKTKDGKIVDARFSKCCGGITELFPTCWQSYDMECLDTFPDPWCDLSGMTSTSRRALLNSVLKDYDRETGGYGYNWEYEISKSDIRKNLKERFQHQIGDIIQLEPLHRGPSGRIDLLRIHGTEGHLDLGKELWIRRALASTHLYSSAFEITDKGENVLLKGKGWGHGVGLCQIGAANMAQHGYSYRDILKFYYPGAEIHKF